MVLLLAAAAWLAQSSRDLHAVQAELAGAKQRRSLIEQESQRLEREASLREKAARARSSEADHPIKTLTVTGRGDVENKKLSALLQSPGLQAEYLAAKRARIGRTYGPLLKELKLSFEQTSRFEAIVMQREEQALDIAGTVPKAMRTSYTGGLWDTGLESLTVGGPASDPDTQAAAELQRQANQAFKAAATDLLGADGYAQLESYERAMPARNITDNLAGELATTDHPLSPDEADQLTQLLANASPSYARGGSANLGQVNWDKLLEKAPSVLSPPQVAGLSQVVALPQAQMHLRTLLQQATSTAR